jgi:hypothetical protein
MEISESGAHTRVASPKTCNRPCACLAEAQSRNLRRLTMTLLDGEGAEERQEDRDTGRVLDQANLSAAKARHRRVIPQDRDRNLVRDQSRRQCRSMGLNRRARIQTHRSARWIGGLVDACIRIVHRPTHTGYSTPYRTAPPSGTQVFWDHDCRFRVNTAWLWRRAALLHRWGLDPPPTRSRPQLQTPKLARAP